MELTPTEIRAAILAVLGQRMSDWEQALPVKEFQAHVAEVLGTSHLPNFWELTKKDELYLKQQGILDKKMFNKADPMRRKGWYITWGPNYDPSNNYEVQELPDVFTDSPKWNMNTRAQVMEDVRTGKIKLIYVRGEIEAAIVKLSQNGEVRKVRL